MNYYEKNLFLGKKKNNSKYCAFNCFSNTKNRFVKLISTKKLKKEELRKKYKHKRGEKLRKKMGG